MAVKHYTILDGEYDDWHELTFQSDQDLNLKELVKEWKETKPQWLWDDKFIDWLINEKKVAQDFGTEYHSWNELVWDIK